MVHVSPLLDNCFNRIEKTLMFKTVEQLELLVGHYPPKLWIRGPAGSGKTMLLLEKAESLASSILEHRKKSEYSYCMLQCCVMQEVTVSA